jgi:hypothetical protein
LSLCIRQILKSTFAEDSPPRHREVSGSVRHIGAAPGFPRGETLGAAVAIRIGLGVLMFRNQLVVAACYSHQLHLILDPPLKPLPFFEIALVLVRFDHVA